MPPQTPQSEAERVSEEAVVAFVAALSAVFAASAYAGALQAAGIGLAWLSASLTAMLRPIVRARILFLRRLADAEFTDALPTAGSHTELVRLFMDQEVEYERVFMQRSARRIMATVERAARDGATGDDLRAAFEQALDRERRLNRIRQQAATRRLLLKIEEANVQSVSPQGAYWLLDPSLKTHTADCLAMAGHSWSWEVLKRVRPSNRHVQCGCRLIPYSMARANGLPDAERVRKEAPRVTATMHR